MSDIHLSENLNQFILNAYKGNNRFLRKDLTPDELRRLCECDFAICFASGKDPATGVFDESNDCFQLTTKAFSYADKLLHEQKQHWQMSRHDYFVAGFGALAGALLSLVCTLIIHFGFS